MHSQNHAADALVTQPGSHGISNYGIDFVVPEQDL